MNRSTSGRCTGFGTALCVALVALWVANPAWSSMVVLSGATRADTLTCVPVDGRPGEWRYLPERVRLATDDEGKPRFSFVRYALPSLAGEAGASTIQEAAGGGILHFVVTLETPAEAVAAAEAALQEQIGDDGIRLVGSVPFTAGRFVLVSAILRKGLDEGERAILAMGRAPVLEGNQLALSFPLEPAMSTLLMESFQSAAPDVSLQFDMTFEGLADAYEARLTVDWDAVRTTQATEAGGSFFFVSADVESSIDDLRQSGAVKLETMGQNEDSEALIQHAYERAVDLLYEPVPPEEIPEGEKQNELLDGLAELTDPKDGVLSSRKLTGLGAYVGYRRKEVSRSGQTTIDLNHRAVVPRHHLVVFNVGDLHARLGGDPEHFRTVNLEDPAFRRRVVEVGVDAALRPEFGAFVNNVVVTLRKVHASGAETLREIVVDGSPAPDDGLRMAYGWDGDDLLEWLRFDVRERWSFQGGGQYETDWRTVDAPMLDVLPPFERREVQVLADPATLNEAGVRSVVVRVSVPFFGDVRKAQVVIRPERPEPEWIIPIVLPRGDFVYEWQVTWLKRDGSREQASGRDDTGLIFADVLPVAENAGTDSESQEE